MTTDLFSSLTVVPYQQTIFNHHGKTTYETAFLSLEECCLYFDYFLHQLPWKQDEYKQNGIIKQTKRKIVWFADDDISFQYSGTNRSALQWDSQVLKIKEQIEISTQLPFNSCLLNLYHDGTEGMAWHSDDQDHLDLAVHGTVVIVSLGAERFFKMRLINNTENIQKEEHKILLEQGSLLVMKEPTQQFWHHEIPKMQGVFDKRISLTFRYMKKK